MAAIDSLLGELLEKNASDLHLVVGRRPLLRIRGELVESSREVLTGEATQVLLGEILTPAQRTTVRTNLDLDFAYELSDGRARFRANILWQHRGMGGVLRVIPAKILTMDQLGLPPVVREIAELPRGLVLVTGPTGSGKSTSLAAMINHLNENHEKHIITIEDPLEFVHQNKKCLVTQREVKTHTRSFAAALRMAAREDPDIVLVGGDFAAALATGAQAMGLASDALVTYTTNDEAIAWLREHARPDDFVLLKGSRMYRMEQIVAGLSA